MGCNCPASIGFLFRVAHKQNYNRFVVVSVLHLKIFLISRL
jgi:hypothetical protein